MPAGADAKKPYAVTLHSRTNESLEVFQNQK